jgi:hypothetical protein
MPLQQHFFQFSLGEGGVPCFQNNLLLPGSIEKVHQEHMFHEMTPQSQLAHNDGYKLSKPPVAPTA